MVATVLADGRVGESILRTGAPQRVLLKGFLDGLAQRRTGPRELREPGRRGIVPVNPNRHNRPNFGAVSQPIDNYREARYLSPDGHLSGGGRRLVSNAYPAAILEPGTPRVLGDEWCSQAGPRGG